MTVKPQCPKCGATLKDDYGMVECPSCGTVVFIDMEGGAHVGSETPAEAAPEIQPAEASADSSLEVEPASAFESGYDPGAISSDFQAPQFSEDTPSDELAPPPSALAPEEHVAESAPSDDADLNMDALLGYQEPEAEAVETEPVELGQPGDPLGLNSFANSEISQAKDGLLSYKILISGIDSKEMRESLREAIEDTRFGWNPSVLMGRISKGHLTLENVSPVKATILINRIKRLPLEIRWEQYAITQLEGD